MSAPLPVVFSSYFISAFSADRSTDLCLVVPQTLTELYSMPNGAQAPTEEGEASGGESQEEEWDSDAAEDDDDDDDTDDDNDDVDEDEEEEEDGKHIVPDGGATSQPQPDRASSNEAHASAPSAGGGDHAEVRQPATPPAGTAVSTDLPDSPVAPLA